MELTIEEEKFRACMGKIKRHCKEFAHELTLKKFAYKQDQKKGKFDIWQDWYKIVELKKNFRHLHIAYCELRGRTRNQIESKVHPDNLANEDLIQKYKDEYYLNV